MHRELHSASAPLAVVALLLAGGLLAGCNGVEEPAGTSPADGSTVATFEGGDQEPAASELDGPLAGTEWRLVEIQSMDDAIGTARPEDPSSFTMRLNGDGTVQMTLDCNRANGSWSAEATNDGLSGHFGFGPLAVTRALCPPPNLDERIAKDAEYVRSYLLQDGRLYLSLMADGGIYAWEPNSPTGVSFTTEPDAELEEAILRASPDYTREIVEVDGRRARYLHSRFDLNGDGSDEVFVYLLGSMFCGSGGCDLMIFSEVEGRYSSVNRFAISRTPVIVSAEKTADWYDLLRAGVRWRRRARLRSAHVQRRGVRRAGTDPGRPGSRGHRGSRGRVHLRGRYSTGTAELTEQSREQTIGLGTAWTNPMTDSTGGHS